ncbi:MAG: ATP-grasp domain-containing protein [Peptococcaceae bacterium]|jgi:glutathione synthase/RimK-type ligase-like ATP-grasp enzyme|nr:ATP-grasp domain-containing protein [Peptococcaceae bacterium]MDH7525734.1 ATP-grasp domain-containing protein [Peptococcaceae bacterium]
MAKIAIFTERYTIRSSVELAALTNYRMAAFELGHQLDFLFRHELKYLHNYDAVFIRALTDPLNTSYVVARLAQMQGQRVIDEPESIRICCDKVNMYKRLIQRQITVPETIFLDNKEVTRENARELFEGLGIPLVLKAPNSSFSHYVEKVNSYDEFVMVGKKFLRRADRIIVQQYIPSEYDWRVILLNGKVQAVVKYVFAQNTWRTMDRAENGELSKVVGVRIEEAKPELLKIAADAAKAIGNSLYGVDIKEVDGEYYVIEVNDNPNIDAGNEDQASPEIYKNIVRYLAGEEI